MRLFVALRLPAEQYAKQVVESHLQNGAAKGTLVDANIARHHPALKNIVSYLISAGALPEKRREKMHLFVADKQADREADFRLYWCEVETDLEVDAWYSQNGVEVVIRKDDFSRFAASIRHKSGSTYIDACEKYAQTLRISHPANTPSQYSRKAGGRAA